MKPVKWINDVFPGCFDDVLLVHPVRARVWQLENYMSKTHTFTGVGGREGGEKGGSAIITHVPRKTSSSLRGGGGDVLLRGAILILAGCISVHPTTILSSATGVGPVVHALDTPPFVDGG